MIKKMLGIFRYFELIVLYFLLYLFLLYVAICDFLCVWLQTCLYHISWLKTTLKLLAS